VTPDEYEAFLNVLSERPPSFTIPLLSACRLNDAEQFRELLSMCESRGEADALIANNGPCVAYIRICTPEPEVEELYAAVKSAPSAEAATVAMRRAPLDVYETVAARLALERLDPDALERQYMQLTEEQL
jgi:hypothetical protein